MLSLTLIIGAVLLFVVAGLIGVGIVLLVNSRGRSSVHKDPHRPSKPQEPLTTDELKKLENLSPEVAQALEGGKKVLAITLYRKDTGLGLKEAKMFIDRIEGHHLLSNRGTLSADSYKSSKPEDSLSAEELKKLENLPPKIEEALQSGKKILAIKEYRVETGASLKEAKDFIDKIEGYFR